MCVRSMIGEPSIDMSTTPPQERSTRSRESAGIIATPASATCSTHGQVAALGVGIVAVDVAAEDEAALVGLGDIEMSGAERDDVVDERLQPFGHEGLQDVAFERQRHAGHARRLR